MSGSHRIHIAAENRTLVSIDDFRIPENRITLLLGESGIGKSLIAKAVYGLLDSDELTISIDGEPYEQYVEKTETRASLENSFFVFQEPSTHLNSLITLADQLREGSLAAAPHQEEILEQLWEKSTAADIRNLLNVYPKPYRPSGGEKQRILLAMAFKKIDSLLARSSTDKGAIFVFDEPSGSLDNHYRNVFLEMLFERFKRLQFTTLLITHDYSMIGRIHERYQDLMGRMSFKELTLRRDSLALREFEPKDYLHWLQQQKPLAAPSASQKPLLSVESGAIVHGRKLIISKDKEGNDVCPLALQRGAMVYLKAASGVGKTTLVKLIMGLVRSARMRIQLDGLVFTERTPRKLWQKEIWGKKMTLVFQHADEALNMESTVRDVFTGLPPLRGTTTEEIAKTLSELFDGDIAGSFLDKKVKHLSGGQKQRLNLLRGMSLNTDVLILDEPLNGLDFESAGKVINILQQKQQAGQSILLISHNEEIFDRLVNEECVYYLRAGTPD